MESVNVILQTSYEDIMARFVIRKLLLDHRNGIINNNEFVVYSRALLSVAVELDNRANE